MSDVCRKIVFCFVLLTFFVVRGNCAERSLVNQLQKTFGYALPDPLTEKDELFNQLVEVAKDNPAVSSNISELAQKFLAQFDREQEDDGGHSNLSGQSAGPGFQTDQMTESSVLTSIEKIITFLESKFENDSFERREKQIAITQTLCEQFILRFYKSKLRLDWFQKKVNLLRKEGSTILPFTYDINGDEILLNNLRSTELLSFIKKKLENNLLELDSTHQSISSFSDSMTIKKVLSKQLTDLLTGILFAIHEDYPRHYYPFYDNGPLPYYYVRQLTYASFNKETSSFERQDVKIKLHTPSIVAVALGGVQRIKSSVAKNYGEWIELIQNSFYIPLPKDEHAPIYLHERDKNNFVVYRCSTYLNLEFDESFARGLYLASQIPFISESEVEGRKGERGKKLLSVKMLDKMRVARHGDSLMDIKKRCRLLAHKLKGNLDREMDLLISNYAYKNPDNLCSTDLECEQSFTDKFGKDDEILNWTTPRCVQKRVPGAYPVNVCKLLGRYFPQRKRHSFLGDLFHLSSRESRGVGTSCRISNSEGKLISRGDFEFDCDVGYRCAQFVPKTSRFNYARGECRPAK